jgi:hypothetical protein
MNRVTDYLNKRNEERLEEFPVKMNMLNCKQLKKEMESLQECVKNIQECAYGDGDFTILSHRKYDLKLVTMWYNSRCKDE